jgi:hypothetical protein
VPKADSGEPLNLFLFNCFRFNKLGLAYCDLWNRLNSAAPNSYVFIYGDLE